jgi:hypothetical protein
LVVAELGNSDWIGHVHPESQYFLGFSTELNYNDDHTAPGKKRKRLPIDSFATRAL